MRRLGGLILSGGPDSAVAAWDTVYNKNFDDVKWRAFHFKYGQMAVPEEHMALQQASELDVPIEVIDVPHGLLTSTMTARSQHRAADNIEPTFVPGRNAFFITLVASRLYDRGNPLVIVGGWNAADSAGYPDCRPGFITLQTVTLGQALDCDVRIVAPVLQFQKHEIISHGAGIGVPFEITWSCYTPVLVEDLWVPCGECVSCQFREKGFREAGIKDPCTGWRP